MAVKTKAVKKRKKPGPKGHVPSHSDRKVVAALAAFGIKQDHIARKVGVTKKTLEKHYRDELDLAMTDADAAVVHNLHKKATGNGPGCVTAAIWWTKARLGWKEHVVNENVGEPGVVVVRERMSKEEWLKQYGGKAGKDTNGGAGDGKEPTTPTEQMH